MLIWVQMTLSLLLSVLGAGPAGAAPLELVASVPLPGVDGRIDHCALDEQHGRLFLAALGNGTLEVVDLKEKKVRKHAEGLHEPQGVLYLAARDEVWVSEGGGAMLDIFRGETLERLEQIRIGPDGDNLRFDEESQQVWLGYASGALGWIDAAGRKALGHVRLPAHPEAFALERKGKRAFANVPGERGVCVIDRSKQEVMEFWPVEAAQANYPLLFLQDAKELCLGCRNPAKLVVLDSDSGKQRQVVELSGDVDDLCFDEARGRIYASCGEGTIDVFARKAPGAGWQRTDVIATAKGARTACFSAARKQLFLAVPKSSEKPAEVRVYETRD